MKISNIILGATAALLLAGCSSKSTYHYGGSSKSSKKVDRSHIKVAPQKMKNSAAMHRATMRPYTVFGKRYYPKPARIGDTQRGISSWYGPNFHAKPTSNGEIYDMYASTAAHKTLPMNTMLRVDNLENGRSTIVRVNDRGPFVGTRIIDLSNKAARAIDMVGRGLADVKITVIGFNGKIASTAAEKQATSAVGRFYVQVGAFSRLEGAQMTQSKFKAVIDPQYDVIIKKGYANNQQINRVWVSGFRSEQEAMEFKNRNDLSSAKIIAQ